MQQSSTGGPCANTRGHSNAALFVQGHILAPTGSTVTFGVGKEMEKPRKKSWEEPTKLIRQKA